MSKKLLNVDFHLHVKQGEEFHNYLQQCKGNVSEAFSLWASVYRDRMDHCNRIAERLKNISVEGYGDTHFVWVNALSEDANAVLQTLVDDEDAYVVDDEDEDEASII